MGIVKKIDIKNRTYYFYNDLIKINSAKCKSNSCILYIVLFSMLFTVNIGIATYFIYYKSINHNKKMVLNMIMFIKEKIINKIKWEL